MAQNIQFIDLPAQQRSIHAPIQKALSTVLSHGQYILGPEVTQLEKALGAYTRTTLLLGKAANERSPQSAHLVHDGGERMQPTQPKSKVERVYTNIPEVITCNSGTDALLLLLMAKKIGPGDAVFVPTFTFAATGEVVALCGATPIFVDVDLKTFNMLPSSLEVAIKSTQKTSLEPKAIIAVDLFGLPADYDALSVLADKHNLFLIADSAQSFGAKIKENRVGTLADATATSFFPSKPLGGYGDGGAIFTEDPLLAKTLRSLRVHGQSMDDKYNNIAIGLNSRLDSFQAAVLLEKLKIFDNELKRRQEIATLYHKTLPPAVIPQDIPKTHQSAFALFTIKTPIDQRDNIMAQLSAANIPTVIYYKKPLHQQKAYAHFPCADKLENSTILCNTVLSLPMHPYLTDEQVLYITNAITKAVT
ncbi:MAG TPA: DegT/DnrJ/EryC1/StrS aminotransferase family protein [Gammaproteobacteria bacterium]|nr:DegT/DnrJ/EryC1/StrS aminotransferase family protein [Gammaproteobacteria bacterium]